MAAYQINAAFMNELEMTARTLKKSLVDNEIVSRWPKRRRTDNSRHSERNSMPQAQRAESVAVNAGDGGLILWHSWRSATAKCRSHRRTGFLETDGSTGSLQSQDFSSRGVGSDARGSATISSLEVCVSSPGCGSA